MRHISGALAHRPGTPRRVGLPHAVMRIMVVPSQKFQTSKTFLSFTLCWCLCVWSGSMGSRTEQSDAARSPWAVRERPGDVPQCLVRLPQHVMTLCDAFPTVLGHHRNLLDTASVPGTLSYTASQKLMIFTLKQNTRTYIMYSKSSTLRFSHFKK